MLLANVDIVMSQNVVLEKKYLNTFPSDANVEICMVLLLNVYK